MCSLVLIKMKNVLTCSDIAEKCAHLALSSNQLLTYSLFHSLKASKCYITFKPIYYCIINLFSGSRCPQV